jgi:pyruvate/2-oxoglutarate/acetoin dehydrogenase E1 component
VPGLRVAVPSNPADAKGLLKAAVRCGDPVMFFEHKRLYMTKGEVPASGDHVVEFGQAAVLREGGDLTIVAIGLMVGRALEAAEALAADGIEATVIDPRTLFPLDLETIVASVERTGRLLTADEAVVRGGFASYIAAEVAERAFDFLEAPTARVGMPAVPFPYSPELEDHIVPAAADIEAEARRLVAY